LNDGTEELYDLERDSLANANLAADPEFAELLRTLRMRMDSITAGAPPPDVR
jgi:hypothetical protein